MGYKYLAGNVGWYDPTDSARSTYKYLRGDNQWVKSDGTHKFLDATGSWSSPMPNKMPTSLYDPNDVKAYGKHLAASTLIQYHLAQTMGRIDFNSLGLKKKLHTPVEWPDLCSWLNDGQIKAQECALLLLTQVDMQIVIQS